MKPEGTRNMCSFYLAQYLILPGWSLPSLFESLILMLYLRRVCGRVQRDTKDSRRQEDCRCQSLKGTLILISLRLLLQSSVRIL